MYSHCKVYRIDVQIERKKSYTKSDRKKFQQEAFWECAHIQALMKECPYDGGHSVRYLMINRLIKPEDLLGIEGLLAGYDNVAYERRHRRNFVGPMRRTWVQTGKNCSSK